LAQRLALRGRENAQQIQERLQRAAQFSPPETALVINNSGKLSDALAQWMPYLHRAIRHVD
jgi:ribose 1,5-bisphosphokinase